MVTVNMLLLKLGGKFRVLQEKRAGSAKEFALVESGYDKRKIYEKTVVVLRAGELAKVVSDTLFSVIITVGDEDEAVAAKSFLARPAVDSGCVLVGDPDVVEKEVNAVRQQFICRESELLRTMLLSEDDEKILEMAENILGMPFFLAWKDLRNLYNSKKMKSLLTYDGGSISPEVAYDLIMDEEFHKALGYQECFYYYNKSLDRYNYCRNIFSNGAYLARMVMFLPEKEARLHPGMEELFSIISEYISSWGISRSRLFRDLMPDPIHETLELILKGNELAEDAMGSVFKASHWNPKDTCTLIKYRFLAGERWTIHKETTFSFLISRLESTWPYSCGVQNGDEIIWLVNLSKSLVDVQSQKFHQQVAQFIREYVCIAGVSPAFQELSLIPQAVRAADIALRIGRKKDPYYWYYFYEDYRREYLLESMKREMPVSMLVPPALLLLQHIDEEQETEYCKTLKSYLDCGYNMTTAAEAIYVHRTTFFRRMERIEKLTGLHLDDGETCQDLVLGFLLLEQ